MSLSSPGLAPDSKVLHSASGAAASLWIVLAGTFLLTLGAAALAEAQSCSLPPSYNCNEPGYGNGRCASCATQPVSCDVWTGCSFGGCPAGYVEIDAVFCGFPTFTYNELCRRTGTQTLWTCSSCVNNSTMYGSFCTPCNCNGNGTCNGGVNGDGSCNCYPGFNGPNCQYSDAVNCNGHGTVNYFGQCLRLLPDGTQVSSCFPGYQGATCNQCAPDYYSYPTCRYCTASATCNGNGTCDGSGFCDCEPEYSGSSCQACAPDRYNYPACTYCTRATTCSGNGSCNGFGQCVCDNANIVGPNCNQCLPGTYGPTCAPCPGGQANPCNGFGTCSSGMGGTGLCACVAGRAGPACEFSDAFECNGNGHVNGDGTCACDPGFGGPNCCPAGSTGPGGCGTDIDECQGNPSPCLNGGTCTNVPGGYTCACAPGHFGPQCQYLDLIFTDGFESGTLGAWSAGATGGGDLYASPAAALKATGTGLEGNVNDVAGLYVQDNTPDDEPRYRARFYLDPNGFDPGEDESHRRTRTLIAFSEAPTRRVAAVVLRRLDGVYSLMARARLDDNSQADTGFFAITDEPHMVEIDLRPASGADAEDGSLELWLDGLSVRQLTGLDNHLAEVDFVRMGALSVKTGAAGTLYFDEFESRRSTYIGP